MKKMILTILLSIFFIFGISMRVDADTLDADGETARVPVKYTVDNTEFVICIPGEIAADTDSSAFIITADKMNLRPDEEVIVRISQGCDEEGRITLVRQNDSSGNPAQLTTVLTTGDKNIAENNYIVGYFKDSDDSTKNTVGYINMSGLKTDEYTKAGDYLAVIEFQVELRRCGNE
ncbi:MAG: hypothetical protein ACI4EN_00050 [Butyrivibrio sp.]